jgi:hypothetical protein
MQKSPEEQMRNIVLTIIFGAGILIMPSLKASAIPAEGAAIARVGQQIDPVINVATKKKKKAAQTKAKPTCANDQVPSTKTGGCIPEKSQY